MITDKMYVPDMLYVNNMYACVICVFLISGLRKMETPNARSNSFFIWEVS